MACDLILGFEWRKKERNLGMRTLRGRFRLSESRISAESSQIFCRAPKAPSHTVSGIVERVRGGEEKKREERRG